MSAQSSSSIWSITDIALGGDSVHDFGAIGRAVAASGQDVTYHRLAGYSVRRLSDYPSRLGKYTGLLVDDVSLLVDRLDKYKRESDVFEIFYNQLSERGFEFVRIHYDHPFIGNWGISIDSSRYRWRILDDIRRSASFEFYR